MKKLILILLLVSSVCFASDNTPTVDSNLTITLPNIKMNDELLNYKVTLKYNNKGYWELGTLSPIVQQVDDYASNVQSVLDEINNYRKNGAPCSSGGLSPLSWNAQLSIASVNHSIDMAANNYFSHTGLNGSSPWDRIADAGYTGNPLGENIAAGSSVKTVVNSWINSSGHCSNIMNTSGTLLGYGWASKSGSDWGIYHTMVIGK